ncbi:MAG: protein-export chaperone SecB [Candidatus Sedimenticola endophacoides]
MSEENQPQEGGQQFALQRIYTKDVSFETPNSPVIFSQPWEPESELALNSNATPLGDDLYEVVLSITVTTKTKDKVAYLVEVQQAGVFFAKGFQDQELSPMLGAYCPNVLFPYAREVVSDLVSKGSFPQLLLTPVNFEMLYQQHQAQRQQRAQQAAQDEQEQEQAETTAD